MPEVAADSQLALETAQQTAPQVPEAAEVASASEAPLAAAPEATPEAAPKEPEASLATSTDVRERLLARVLAAHQSYYDVKRDYVYGGRLFPAVAEFHTYGEQYVLVKRAKLWEVETHDFMFFELVEKLDAAQLQDEVEFMTTKAIGKVEPGPNHMSSGLSLVVIANECTDEALKAAKKTRFRKNFKLGFEGWADLRLAVVDVSREGKEAVVTNAVGKKLAETLRGNLALARQTTTN